MLHAVTCCVATQHHNSISEATTLQLQDDSQAHAASRASGAITSTLQDKACSEHRSDTYQNMWLSSSVQ
jgi:hypothetical protein